jgi:hypothetical protein
LNACIVFWYSISASSTCFGAMLLGEGGHQMGEHFPIFRHKNLMLVLDAVRTFLAR